jgi:hypothetical protein
MTVRHRTRRRWLESLREPPPPGMSAVGTRHVHAYRLNWSGNHDPRRIEESRPPFLASTFAVTGCRDLRECEAV